MGNPTQPLRLPKRVIEAARLTVAGKSNTQIAREMKVSVGTVKNYKNQMYQAFGFSDVDKLPEAERQRILREVIGPGLGLIEASEEVQEETEDGSAVIQEADSEPNVEPPVPPPPLNTNPPQLPSPDYESIRVEPQTPRLRWLIAAGVVGALVMMLCVCAAVIFLIQLSANQIQGVDDAQNTSALPSTEGVIELQPVFIATAPPPTATGVELRIPIPTAIPPSVTAVMLQVASATPKPTVPSPTPVTPTPTPTPMPLPFVDNFTGGKRPEWRQVSAGDVVISSQGMVNAGGQVTFEIGDSSLRDYTVEFDASNLDFIVYFGPQFRFREVFNNYHNVMRNVCIFERKEGVNWVQKFESDQCLLGGGRIKFVIQGDSYALYKDGQKMGEKYYEGVQVRGPIAITLAGATIDNFRLSVP